MKYIHVLFALFLFAYGCSSSQNEERREQDLKKIRRTVDSLKVLKGNMDKSLDSLNSVSRKKDLEMKTMQNQLDSLQKNMNENK
ncbi:MAG: hypothetical protein LWX07_12700 [Bacteroidetes bacterium]|nr:hypothetical protein [Bacteroidota bacterium]